ncbi:hypothetical protein AVEN_237087-1 [Araneus ventricosus]|uniref:Uncharacterized protein n=1 Tax=Araneus ventricosus TaxID=182803 RepID=A0A4Y2V8F8_ARAVE|nr:hypothetical protein AVEN_237087-1 [Araneus ventricosus]
MQEEGIGRNSFSLNRLRCTELRWKAGVAEMHRQSIYAVGRRAFIGIFQLLALGRRDDKSETESRARRDDRATGAGRRDASSMTQSAEPADIYWRRARDGAGAGDDGETKLLRRSPPRRDRGETESSPPETTETASGAETPRRQRPMRKAGARRDDSIPSMVPTPRRQRRICAGVAETTRRAFASVAEIYQRRKSGAEPAETTSIDPGFCRARRDDRDQLLSRSPSI